MMYRFFVAPIIFLIVVSSTGAASIWRGFDDDLSTPLTITGTTPNDWSLYMIRSEIRSEGRDFTAEFVGNSVNDNQLITMDFDTSTNLVSLSYNNILSYVWLAPLNLSQTFKAQIELLYPNVINVYLDDRNFISPETRLSYLNKGWNLNHNYNLRLSGNTGTNVRGYIQRYYHGPEVENTVPEPSGFVITLIICIIIVGLSYKLRGPYQ